MIKFYVDEFLNKYFKYKNNCFYKIESKNSYKYVIDDFGKDILKNGEYGGFSYIDIDLEKEIIPLEKDAFIYNNIIFLKNEKILVKSFFDIIDKRLFNNGRCIEFSFVLKNILEKHNIKNLEYGQIIGKIKKNNYYFYEICHGIINIKNTNLIIDIDGINIFNQEDFENNLISYGFSSKPEDIFLKIVDDKTFQKTYEKLNKYNIIKSKNYLKQNHNFINNIISILIQN